MDYKYHLAENTIPKEDIDALVDWLKTYPHLTKGELTWEFERKWAELVGSKYAVLCNSGSSANLLAMAALKYGAYAGAARDDMRVLMCAAGWITTLTPALHLGMPVHLVEVDKQTFGMDVKDLEEAVRRCDPFVVVVVHTLGVPADINGILELGERYDFEVMEDACPAVGSTQRGQCLGTFGSIGTFSLYYGHQLSTIEGGVVVTDDPRLYQTLLMLRSHGWSKDLVPGAREMLARRHGISEFQDAFTFYLPGFNLRATDVNAFLGLRQLQRFNEVADARHERFHRYQSQLRGDFIVQNELPGCTRVSCITFPFICESGEERDKVVAALNRFGIENRPISGGNLGEQPVWMHHLKHAPFAPPFAHKLHTCGISVPCHPDLSLEDVDFISNVILEAI